MIQKSRFRIGLCGLLIGLMLCVIWGNSLLNGESSGNVSGWFGRFLGHILPVFGPDNPNGSYLLRKCAHFTEFLLLGSLLCWMTAMLLARKGRIVITATLCGITAAAIDEGIQRFVPGRAGCIQDVLLDSCGVLTGVLLLLLLFHLYKMRRAA